MFVNFAPQFGSNPNKTQKKMFSTFSNYTNGEFINLENTEMMTGDISISEFFKKDGLRVPPDNLKPLEIDLDSFKSISKNSSSKISWLGHSAFIINLDGKIILLDPMLGDYASPIPLPPLKRYSEKIAFNIDDLGFIDGVLISHDHYDHLDYSTIKRIRNNVGMFYVPFGIMSHLEKWGIPKEKITEMNWEEVAFLQDIELTCLPARHFSGRGLLNRNSTLWCSWAIESSTSKIYFSGDSGFGFHLYEIGKKYGPFDLALIDCGQYNDAWKFSHMFPEQGVEAARVLNAKFLMPIHWGAFTLATHPWNEPVKRALLESNKKNQKIITPQIGQVIHLNNLDLKYENWWNYKYL
jgi:L-ascorbate metabolism protein UlaG (beta-lactamase superfamily)